MTSITKVEGRWSKEENKLFLESHLALHNDWRRIQEHIKSRSLLQIRSHSQKFHKRLRNKFIIKNYSLYNEIDKEKQKELVVNSTFYELLRQVDQLQLLNLANQLGVYLSHQFKQFLDELKVDCDRKFNELDQEYNDTSRASDAEFFDTTEDSKEMIGKKRTKIFKITGESDKPSLAIKQKIFSIYKKKKAKAKFIELKLNPNSNDLQTANNELMVELSKVIITRKSKSLCKAKPHRKQMANLFDENDFMLEIIKDESESNKTCAANMFNVDFFNADCPTTHMIKRESSSRSAL